MELNVQIQTVDIYQCREVCVCVCVSLGAKGLIIHNFINRLCFLQVRDFCFQTCLLHLTRFHVCLLESIHCPVVWQGERVHALIHGVSGCDFQSSSFSYSVRIFYSPSLILWNHNFVHYSRSEVWKFLKRQIDRCYRQSMALHCRSKRRYLCTSW
jgi:hypothetical protein